MGRREGQRLERRRAIDAAAEAWRRARDSMGPRGVEMRVSRAQRGRLRWGKYHFAETVKGLYWLYFGSGAGEWDRDVAVRIVSGCPGGREYIALREALALPKPWARGSR